MARKMKRQTEPSFSSDDGSAADDMSTEETAHSSSSSSSSSSSRRRRRRRRRRASGARKRNHNMNNQGKVISILTEIKEEMHIISEKINDDKDETSEIHKKLARLTESHNDQSKRLEKLTESYNGLLKQLELRTNDTSDDSAAPRSQLNQGQPRYRLEFKSGVSKSIDKGKNLEIKVALVDCNNDRTVENGPLSSATVELVVISAEFNQHDNQYNWSREDFESNIKKARQGNSGTGDVDQSVTSIVSNGRFNLVHGAKCHNGSKIFSNSSNKKVRLGVMVVSPTEERVLEGLSSAFYVRGHDRPTRQCKVRDSRSNRPWVYSGYQEQNVTMPNMQSIPLPNSTQGLNIIGAQPQLPLGSTTMLSMESSTSASNRKTMALIQQDQVPHWQTMSALPHIDELSLFNSNFVSNDDIPVYANGTQFSCDQIAFPVQLIWDRPYVGPSKRRCNLLDQHDKSNNCGLPTTRLTRDNFGSSNIKPKDVEIMQTHRRSGVLIEPDDSDEERSLTSRLHNKHRLGFVNKVCEAYYTMDPIKADDGNHLKVALFDENNAKVTFGPLSSASVEIVVLHGDFNNHDLDYWTREEFSRSVVCPHPGKEASVLGGDCILVLVDGEACLSDAFFHKTSFCARTGKFKMGVMLASAQYERIQEGISEPFLVKHRPLAALPPGSRLHRQTYTEEKQIVRYMCHRATGSKRQCYPHHSGSKRQRVLLERMTTQQKQQKLPNIAAGDRRALGTKNNVNDASSSSAGFTLFFYGPVALPVTASCSLLQRCFFCQAELFQDRALYMYRGDRAFCSQTCRRKHIRREAMDCARVAAAGSSLHRRQQPLMG